VTLVAPPKPFTENPMTPIQEIKGNWIAIVPYSFTPHEKAEVRFRSQHQWWGERPEGVVKTIELAKEAQIKTMLKPQVWSHGWWTGDYDFAKETDWIAWEKQYEEYILYYAAMADSLDVDLFCMGTEFKNAIKKRPQYWDKLIDKVRDVYHGPLTYAANWDNFNAIPFWDKLDYISINAYFPLDAEKTPDKKELIRAWKRPLQDIRSCQKKYDKPVIFTEYGYLSVDRAAHNNWELEGDLESHPVNQQAQANAIDALHSVFSTEEYWKGGFLWKWYPEMQGHEGHPHKDYSPQGKLAENVLKKWFESSMP